MIQEDRASKEKVGQALKACFEGNDLQNVLDILARVMVRAHRRAPLLWCWQVTMWPERGHLLRLNVSSPQKAVPKECVRIKLNGEVALFVERDAFGQEESGAIKQLCRGVGIEPWKTESQRRDCIIVPRTCVQHLSTIYELARVAHDAMIERYTQWPLSDRYREKHSRGLTAFIRESLGDPNVCDPDDDKPLDSRIGMPKQYSLFEKADDGHLSERDSGEPDEVQEALDAAEERAGKRTSGQGRTDPIVRRAIEQYAMAKAEEYYRAEGWQVDPSVATSEPYDLRCTRDSVELHVEVKGTQSEGHQIILTYNEVDHACNYSHVELFIVTRIALDESGLPSGGEVHGPWRPWEIDEGQLKVIAYVYTVPPL